MGPLKENYKLKFSFKKTQLETGWDILTLSVSLWVQQAFWCISSFAKLH